MSVSVRVARLAGRFSHGQQLAGLRRLRPFSTEISSKDKKEIEKMTGTDRVVLFMKGDREQPLCGFSNLLVKVLDIHGVPYSTFNVLDDPSLRQGIKVYSDWPTIPQLYVNGKFVGGSDILLEMHQKGELVDFFRKEGMQSRLQEGQDEKPDK